MSLLWDLEFLNHNSQRAYPLTEWATRQDLSGVVTLPNSFLVAMKLPVHAGNDVQPEKFFVRSVLVSPTGYKVTIAYDDESSEPPLVAAVNIPKSSHTENRSYALSGLGDFEDSWGQLTIGNLQEISELPPGEYLFDYAGGAIELDAIQPMLRGITSVTLVNGNDRSPRLYGDLEFVALNNSRLTTHVVNDELTQIQFSAIDGENLNEDCVCEVDELGPCIRTINGVRPSVDQNFRLEGNTCLTINPIANGLQLADVCSDPCCGCEELDRIRQQVDKFGDGKATLESHVSRLQAEVSQMSMVVLGSRIGDQGCNPC